MLCCDCTHGKNGRSKLAVDEVQAGGNALLEGRPMEEAKQDINAREINRNETLQKVSLWEY
jgi:hypothetical protein